MVDEFGDRMKAYEAETEIRLDVHKPVCVRIDGRSFSTFTKGMKKPFDEEMSEVMVKTASTILEKTHAVIAYTQSDEISLIYQAEEEGSDIIFSGRVQKMASVLASLAASAFMWHLRSSSARLAGRISDMPHFDARVWQVPTEEEAANVLLWRWKDARRNAILSLGQSAFSAKQIHGKTTLQILDMLTEKGINFDTYPPFFKSGTFLRRVMIQRMLSDTEKRRIPLKHQPTGPVIRTEVMRFYDNNFIGRQNRSQRIFPPPNDAEGAENGAV